MVARTPQFRTIIHMDLDAFYCAVEEQRDPTLRGKAFAVGGRPDERGVVASCSYAARARGVHSAMSMAIALRLCPQLLVVATRHSEYREVSKRVMALLRGWTPQLEQLSIDEAFLDVTNLVGSPVELETAEMAGAYSASTELTGRAIAVQLQHQVREQLGLSCSLGVASNKMVAKIATDQGKAAVGTGQSPQALCVVAPGEEASFLAPLPVSALWGVGPKTGERLLALGITTIGELAQWSPRELARLFGRHGYDLSQHARGIDHREIVTERESKSISSETTFLRDVQDWDVLRATVSEQAASVASQLQKQKLNGTTVKIKLRWDDFSTTTRQATLATPTDQKQVVEKTAAELLKQLWQSEQPVRLLGVGVSGLSAIRQLSLWDEPDTSNEETEAEVSRGVEGDAGQVLSGASSGEIFAAEISSSLEDEEKGRQRERKARRLRQAIDLLEARFGASVVHKGMQNGDARSPSL